ncbi:uncharacterized protein [Typha angustifolia]|uniref:uncharacterized protein isoform X1 n=2 Tax=Typha angustifolia TaxID=59011 RepID=UPI003C2DDF84
MIEQFISFVIRPPRAEYNPDQYLWESEFTLAGRKFKRLDLELSNGRGDTLQCSHYVPFVIPENTALPCVIYCHGNSGCRADANEAAMVLLPSNITVFTLDFSGSGLSGGDYVSLGWHEKEDLRIVISYLRSNKKVSCIGLWGRSMGAVTSLLYGAEDPSIAGMVLDSAFSNLFDLMVELVDVYKIQLPKFMVKLAIQYMRRVIQKRAKFDIMGLNAIQFAPKTYIPALFGHASEDRFIQPHHSDHIYQAYAGDKNIIKFEGNHNSRRPQFYYDSVWLFFYNVLQPPQISSICSSKMEKYSDMGHLKAATGAHEKLLYDIISGVHRASTDASSSSSAPPSIPKGSSVKSVVQLLSESISHMALNNANNLDKSNSKNEECCSYLSSNKESWGRCSSLGEVSKGSSSGECTGTFNNKCRMAIRAFATPLRCRRKPSPKQKGQKKRISIWKKMKCEKLEKGQKLSQRLRVCILGRSKHRRHLSS